MDLEHRNRCPCRRGQPILSITPVPDRSVTAVPKVWSVDPKGSANSFQGIRGYIYVMATLKGYLFLNQRNIHFLENNPGVSLIDDMIISYDL